MARVAFGNLVELGLGRLRNKLEHFKVNEHLVTHDGEFGINFGGVSFGGGSVSFGGLGFLSFVPDTGVYLSFGFKSFNDISVLPANFVAKSAKTGDFSAWKRSDFFQSGGDLEFLLDIEWWWATVEALKSFVGSGTSSGFVWEHTSDHPLDHRGWGSVVKWTVFRVGSGSVVHLFEHDQLVSVVVTSDEDTFASDNADVVASEKFFGDGGTKSTGEVVLGVNDDVLFECFSHESLAYKFSVSST